MKKLLATLLVLSLLVLSLVSCGGKSVAPGRMEAEGACAYASTRSTEGRDVGFVVMTVKDFGDITLLLDKTTAPLSAGRFLELCEKGFYDGLDFHRVMAGFMIQGGAPNASSETVTPIRGEFLLNAYYGNDLSHIRGVISLARTTDPDSATSQFFICNDDARRSLDRSYAAFGYVLNGMNIVDAITEYTLPYADTSNNNIIGDASKRAVIESARVVTAEEIGYVSPAAN